MGYNLGQYLVGVLGFQTNAVIIHLNAEVDFSWLYTQKLSTGLNLVHIPEINICSEMNPNMDTNYQVFTEQLYCKAPFLTTGKKKCVLNLIKETNHEK